MQYPSSPQSIGGFSVGTLYDEFGRVKTVTDNSGTSTYTLDVLDRVTQIVPSGGRKTATLSYFIDAPTKAWKVRTQLAGVSGFWETLEDTKGRAYQQLNPLNQVFTTEYFRDGQPKTQFYANNTRQEYLYSARGLLQKITTRKNGGAVLDELAYAHDPDGRVLTETDLGDQVHGFAYDPLGQLSSETHPDLGSGIFYHYDAHGNRTQVIEDGVIEYYSHDKADKLLWTNTNSNQEPNGGQNKKYALFEYDGFGQMSRRDRRVKTGGSRKTHHFAWDTQGRLRQVKDGNTVKFTALYAGDGERVEKTDAATGSHIYSFGLQDTGDGGTLYTPGLSQRRGSTDRFFHHDWLGSSRYLTNGAGNDAPSAYRYSAFGKLTAQDGPDDQTYFGFAGAWGYETEVQGGFDLQYLYQRYYDPQVGRFISRDPIGWAGGLNLYGYVENDAANYVDPDGLQRVYHTGFGAQHGVSHAYSVVGKYKANILAVAKKHRLQPEVLGAIVFNENLGIPDLNEAISKAKFLSGRDASIGITSARHFPKLTPGCETLAGRKQFLDSYYSSPNNALEAAVSYLRVEAMFRGLSSRWGKWDDYEIALLMTSYNGNRKAVQPSYYGKKWLFFHKDIRHILGLPVPDRKINYYGLH